MSFCTNCGSQISDRAVLCVKCGMAVPQRHATGDNTEAALRFVVPVGRSGWAIASGYLGLVSLIPFVGILAIATGILAIRDINKHQDKHGLGRAWFGIVMGALTVVVYTFAFLVAHTTPLY